MAAIYLSLGSNLGDRQANLRRAIEELRAEEIAITRVSSFYETEPAELRDQPWFLNCAVAAETDLDPVRLLAVIEKVEGKLGRLRDIPNGPRTVDIDLLFHGATVMSTPQVTVPHPRMAWRRFVLEPLAEIAPGLRHPVTGRTVGEMFRDLQDPLMVRKAS